MLPKSIDFSASECSDIGLMSEPCYVFFEVNEVNAQGFLWRTTNWHAVFSLNTKLGTGMILLKNKLKGFVYDF